MFLLKHGFRVSQGVKEHRFIPHVFGKPLLYILRADEAIRFSHVGYSLQGDQIGIGTPYPYNVQSGFLLEGHDFDFFHCLDPPVRGKVIGQEQLEFSFLINRFIGDVIGDQDALSMGGQEHLPAGQQGPISIRCGDDEALRNIRLNPHLLQEL